MTLREFHALICKEFNDGNPLHYKYTRKDGYWKITEGYQFHGVKEMDSNLYVRMIEDIKRDVAKEHANETRSRGRPTKKVQNKYIGDLYE